MINHYSDEYVKSLHHEIHELEVAARTLIKEFRRQSGYPDQTDVIRVWRDSPGDVSITREMQAKVDALRVLVDEHPQGGR